MSMLAKFPSKFLKGDDIEPGEIVTIKEVRDELVGTDQDCKPVMYLNEHDRGIVLNRTNARALVKVLGDDEKTWPGKKVELRTEPVFFKNELTNAIRMSAVVVPARREVEQVANELDDVIPF